MKSKVSPKQGAESPFPGWGWYFAGLIVLNLLPMWVFPFFPSQDGAAHLHSAVALRALASDDMFFQGYYESNWRIASNQAYHLMLVGLSYFFSFLVAEKLILSLYVIALPIAILFAIRQLRSRNSLAVFLVFPVIYSYVLHMGFYNYCLGLIVFLLAIGLYFRFTRAPTPSNSIVLSAALLVTYFFHVVVTAGALLAIGSMAVARLLSGIFLRQQQPKMKLTGLTRSKWKEAGLLALAIMPVIIVSIDYLLSTVNFVAREDASLFSMVTKSLPKLVVAPSPLQALTTFSMVDLLISLPWALLLLILAGISLKTDRRHGDDNQYVFLGFGVVVFLILILAIPKAIGPIHFLFGRFLPYFYFLYILWLSTKSLTPFIWRHAVIFVIALSVANIAYRLPIYAELNYDIAEFTSAASHIEDNSTVFSIVLGKTVPGGLSKMGPRLRFEHIKPSTPGYIGLQRRIVNLGNYQAVRDYFPIKFRDETNPHLLLFGYGGKFEINFDAYETETGRKVDYVLLWGSLDKEIYREEVSSLLSEISRRYTLVYVSKPRGLMRLYRANTNTSLQH